MHLDFYTYLTIGMVVVSVLALCWYLIFVIAIRVDGRHKSGYEPPRLLPRRPPPPDPDDREAA